MLELVESPPRSPPSRPPLWSSLVLAGVLDAEELVVVFESPPRSPPSNPPSWSSELLEELGAGVDEAPESPPRMPPSRPPSLSSLEELGAGLLDVVGSGKDGAKGDVGDGEAGSDVSSVGVMAADEAGALETAVSEVQIELVTVEAPAGAPEGVPVMVCV